MSSRFGQMLAVVLMVALLLDGCATGPGQRREWGHEADFTPGWAAFGRAVHEAATDPYTWVPIAGAAALQIGDADNEIADWARREHPLFGSTDTAKDASDVLRLAALGAYVGIGLWAPSSDEQWWADKRTGFAVGAATLLANKGATSVLKTTFDRTRPNGRNQDSFPSGHTSTATAAARLASDALDSYDFTPVRHFVANAGLFSLAAATGWARVEAGEHHPADVLAGAALGNFLSVLTTRLFLHPAKGTDARMLVDPLPGGGVVTIFTRF